MANYNPHTPHILGQEWVPIRETDVALPMHSPNRAYGQRLPINSAQSLNELRWYTRDYPSDLVNANIVAEVYPTNLESFTGPIKRVLIPASSGTVTGSVTFASGSMQASLLNPSDNNAVNVNLSNTYATAPGFTVYFAGNTYANVLNGKRILGINVLYQMHSFFSREELETHGGGDGSITMSLATTASSFFVGLSNWDLGAFNSVPFDINPPFGFAAPDNYQRVPLGLANVFFGGGGTPATNEWAPWIPADLGRFEASNANRIGVNVQYSAPSAATVAFSSPTSWNYMALEIFYCEENRVAVGISNPKQSMFTLQAGTVRTQNGVTLRHPVTRAATPSVGPGLYTALVYPAENVAFTAFNLSSPDVEVESLRQLYPIPSLAGVVMDMPYPYTEAVLDRTFSSEDSNVIPHLSLHTSSAVITDTHPYGRQAKAEVYGSITATQEILDTVAGGAQDYPQVRFYARRFGETSVPLTLSSASFASSTASITPDDFDALPDLIDGWKEVTLRFATAPSMGAGTVPQWLWSATGELSGNRWEILGASALSLSGAPGNLFQTSNQQLGTATYGAPVSGAQVNLGWVPGFSPMVTSTTDDQSADAVIMFSTDPATPEGLAVSPLSQALAVTDPNCPGVDPSCIPSALFYNQVSWDPLDGVSFDSFNRIAASGWGSTELGQDWIEAGVAAYFSVDGEYGVHAHPASASTTVTATVDVGSPHVETQFAFTIDTLDTAGTLEVQVHARKTDDNNLYRATVSVSTAQVMTLSISKIVASTPTTLVTYATPNLVHTTSGVYNLKFRVAGQYLFAKLWENSQSEPAAWNIWTTDTSLTTGNQVALRSVDNSAAGSAVNFLFNNFSVQPADFGALELQRYDPVDTEFNTIMLATSAAVTGFNDYEARVGQQSVYRIRQRNVYDFAGLWSSQVTGSVASPGVSGAGVALTLFTTNERQDGSSNLAYSAAWEGRPTESFQWAEAQQVALQLMYSKDFPTAFRPLERGGEAFSRMILVNAAGVPLTATQNGFKYLRDMAWDTVNYICVRDELGNRWYSTVLVSEGTRRRMVAAGHLSMASVQVIETSATPYPVDPT